MKPQLRNLERGRWLLFVPGV